MNWVGIGKRFKGLPIYYNIQWKTNKLQEEKRKKNRIEYIGQSIVRKSANAEKNE